MNIFLLVLPWAAIGIAVAVAAAGAVAGKNVFKKQGVAWVLTIVMVCVAVGIGYAKAPVNNPAPEPELPGAPNDAASFVWDDADVLSSETVRALDQRNERLWKQHGVSIGVVTCNYGRDDLDQYAMKRAEEMGLGGFDMIVALDISGDNYWLIQGIDIRRDFTDQDCSDYAYEYMEYDFARGFYGDGLLSLTEALESWYEAYFD